MKKSVKMFLALLTLLAVSITVLLIGCCQHRVKTNPLDSESSYDLESSFISLKEVAPNIVMDSNTGVLYVREKHKTYGIGLYIYTTFPIMKADGTCLTYKEWKSNFSEVPYVVNVN